MPEGIRAGHQGNPGSTAAVCGGNVLWTFDPLFEGQSMLASSSPSIIHVMCGTTVGEAKIICLHSQAEDKLQFLYIMV